jgi:hypothetical protein
LNHLTTSQGPSSTTQWLKDLPYLEGSNVSGSGGSTTVMHVSDAGMLITNESYDLDMLVQFEEEQERRGHFELIFPKKSNIDTYRSQFSYQRRHNIVLWSYIRQNCPIDQLKRIVMHA